MLLWSVSVILIYILLFKIYYISNTNLNLCRTVVSSWELNLCLKTLTFHFRLVQLLKIRTKNSNMIYEQTPYTIKKYVSIFMLQKKNWNQYRWKHKYKKKKIIHITSFWSSFRETKNILHRKSKGIKDWLSHSKSIENF